MYVIISGFLFPSLLSNSKLVLFASHLWKVFSRVISEAGNSAERHFGSTSNIRSEFRLGEGFLFQT